MSADIQARDEGTLWLVKPLSPAGKNWLDENIQDEALVWGDAIVIEHGFIQSVIEGIIADGLEVKRDGQG
jgi:hypothetical protein